MLKLSRCENINKFTCDNVYDMTPTLFAPTNHRISYISELRLKQELLQHLVSNTVDHWNRVVESSEEESQTHLQDLK